MHRSNPGETKVKLNSLKIGRQLWHLKHAEDITSRNQILALIDEHKNNPLIINYTGRSHAASKLFRGPFHTLLHYAIYVNDNVLINKLIQTPCLDITLVDNKGNTPFLTLMMEYAKGKGEINHQAIQFFLHHPQVDSDESSKSGQNIIDCALSRPELFQYLPHMLDKAFAGKIKGRKHAFRWHSLLRTLFHQIRTIKNDPENRGLLLECFRRIVNNEELGVNLNKSYEDKTNLLLMATQFGMKDVVAILLYAGVKTTVKDAKRRSVIQIAKINKHKDIEEMLAGHNPLKRSVFSRRRDMEQYITGIDRDNALAFNPEISLK